MHVLGHQGTPFVHIHVTVEEKKMNPEDFLDAVEIIEEDVFDTDLLSDKHFLEDMGFGRVNKPWLSDEWN